MATSKKKPATKKAATKKAATKKAATKKAATKKATKKATAKKATAKKATAAQIEQELAAGELRPVYFLAGDAFARDRAARTIRDLALDGQQESAFNVDAFIGKEATAARVLGAARTLPMLGARRLVQVRDAQQIPADQLADLLPYIEDPAPTTCLLFIADKVDARTKFFQRLGKLGALTRFDALKDRQVPEWIAGEAARQSIALGPGAAQRVADAVGNDMAQLSAALERLDLYVGAGKTISREDVDMVLAQTRQHSIFELTNAVGRRDQREALLVLKQMIGARESGVRIVSMLARHVRQLWLAKELDGGGMGREDIAREIGAHPFFVRDIIAQSRRFDTPTLRRTHRALFEADRALKSSRLPDGLLLDQLVLKLTRPPAVGASRR